MLIKTETLKRHNLFITLAVVFGLFLLCAVSTVSVLIDRNNLEETMLKTVNYMKVQCSTYTKFNESNESQSLLRTIENSRQISKKIATSLQSGDSLSAPLLRELARQFWVSGVVVLDKDGNIVCEYHDHLAIGNILNKKLHNEVLLDTAIYPQKTYTSRINLADGAHIDYGACTRTDKKGVIVSYYFTSAEYAQNYTLTLQSLLSGFSISSDGTIIVADEGKVIASNNTAFIGQKTIDNVLLQELKGKANSKHISFINANGKYYLGIMLKQRAHYIYEYVPFTKMFHTVPQNIMLAIIVYLLILFCFYAFGRRANKEYELLQVARDKIYKDRLKEEAKKAEQANIAKTRFLQRMSHDIRTPINGICGMLEVAEYYKHDLKKQDECRAQIRVASKLLLELVNEVLDMGKLESGNVVLEEIPFNLKDIALEVITVIERLASERGISVIHDGKHVNHWNLVGSPAHVKRLLMNILSNAVKYNREHGKIIINFRELCVVDDTVTIEFTCEDNGLGMTPEFMQKVFDPFAQENNENQAKYAGSGLGMAISKALVEKMGGTISVESSKDVGTTFCVTIPFKIASIANKVSSEHCQPITSIKDLHILLVEDNELNMEISSFMLEKEGAIITKAYNGQDALDKFKASKEGFFDAILMDVMMPVTDGYEATKKIRALVRTDANTVPIIAMTANAFVEDKMKAKNAGMNEHLAKPLNSKQVINTIAVMVGNRRNIEMSLDI